MDSWDAASRGWCALSGIWIGFKRFISWFCEAICARGSDVLWG